MNLTPAEVRRSLSRAIYLVARDSEGELWRIAVMNRDPDGVPSVALYRCRAGRRYGPVTFAFVDRDERTIAEMHHDNLPGIADDVIEISYGGVC